MCRRMVTEDTQVGFIFEIKLFNLRSFCGHLDLMWTGIIWKEIYNVALRLGKKEKINVLWKC